jgi:hypothetical protein
MISKGFQTAACLSLSVLVSACISSPRPENSIEALAYWHDCMDEVYFNTGRISFRGHHAVGMTHEQAIDRTIGRCTRELNRYEQALVAEGKTEEEAAEDAAREYYDVRNYMLATTTSGGSRWVPRFR